MRLEEWFNVNVFIGTSAFGTDNLTGLFCYGLLHHFLFDSTKVSVSPQYKIVDLYTILQLKRFWILQLSGIHNTPSYLCLLI